jgi:hypothetical protein
MTVRDEIAQTPSETGAWSREGLSGEPVCCSGVSAIAVEAFMNNQG